VFLVYVSYRVPEMTRTATERFQFVYGDFRSGVYWWFPLIILKETACASAAALLPGNGANQLIFTALVTMLYLFGTMSYKPYPSALGNSLDSAAHAGIVLECVYSFQFDFERTEEAVAEIILFVLQIIGYVVPGVLTFLLVWSARSAWLEKSLNRSRTNAVELLKALQKNKPDPTWDGLAKVVDTFQFDEVEMANIVEVLSAMAARSSDTDRLVTRRLGSAVQVRKEVVERRRRWGNVRQATAGASSRLAATVTQVIPAHTLDDDAENIAGPDEDDDIASAA
jgi:hypothetical protein